MRCCCIVKGFILKVNEKEGTAQVQGEDGTIYENVLLVNPYGTHSIPKVGDSMEITLSKSMGSKDVVTGIAFDYENQDILPAEKQGDYTVGSVVGGNYTQYKQDGNTVEKATQKTINANTQTNGNVDINGNFSTNNITNLGEAIALVLNQNAVMQVVIPSGSSAGTYQVQIQSAGQTKTKA